MGWPQWTWIVLAGIGWLYTLAKHGEEKTGSQARHDVGMMTASLGVAVLLLWQGGFFNGCGP